MAPSPTIICLTPVRNEAWILRRFLECTSLWADVILVADQFSTDGSAEIVKDFPKAVLIRNEAQNFDEVQRQKLLLRAAREYEGPKILFALDADEMFGGAIRDGLQVLRDDPPAPGTVIEACRINFTEDLNRYEEERQRLPVGYVDDGTEHCGKIIHNYRFPVPEEATKISLPGTVLMHFQYVCPGRMASKHRWYQCFERVHFPKKRASSIFRLYHSHRNWQKNNLPAVPENWFDFYRGHGIDPKSWNLHDAGPYYWDVEIMNWFREFGVPYFEKLDIWDFEFEELANRIGFDRRGHSFQDPRSRLTRKIHAWLYASLDQPKRWDRLLLRGLIRPFGW